MRKKVLHPEGGQILEQLPREIVPWGLFPQGNSHGTKPDSVQDNLDNALRHIGVSCAGPGIELSGADGSLPNQRIL